MDLRKKKPIVLIVDDDEVLTGMLKMALEVNRFPRVLTASNYEEAFAILELYRTHRMILLVDLKLGGDPKKDGRALLRDVADVAAHRVVAYVMTGSDDNTIRMRAVNAGAFGLITKGKAHGDIIDEVLVNVNNETPWRALERGTKDPRTGFWFHQVFADIVKAELKEARDRPDKKHHKVFSLLFGDLNYFKRVNDTFGHEIGNRALQLVAAAILSKIRPADHPCRYGGDEFEIWLPGETHRRALAKGAEIKRAVRAIDLRGPNGERVPLSMSFGAVQLRRSDIGVDISETFEDFERAADDALYKAKERRPKWPLPWPVVENVQKGAE